MNAFLESLGVWLADFLVLATALLALSLVLRLVIRQPAARVALAWSTWLGLMAIAVLSAVPAWPRYAIADMALAWKSAEPRSVQQPGANLLPEERTPDVLLAEPSAPISHIEPMPVEAPAPPVVAAPAMLPLRSLAGGAWLVAAGLGVIWIVIGMVRTRGLLARAKEAPAWARDELRSVVTNRNARERRRLPGLWSSERVDSAIALGAIQPHIVLPLCSFVPANRPAVRAALAHEWAHIRHGDLWLLALERLLLPLLAVHPLFWWLRRVVRLDQELLADAAAAGEQRVEYAEALLAWAKSARSTRHGLAAIGLWENPSTLSRRVAMILDSKRPLSVHFSRAWAAALVAILVPVIVGLSLVTLRPLAAQDEPAPTAEDAAEVIESDLNLLKASQFRPLPPAPEVPQTIIHLSLIVMSVDRQQLVAADTTLEDAIAQATESRCGREAGLIMSDISAGETTKLIEGLKRHDALKVISRPQISTLDGREASLHVGGKSPVLRVEETINGRHERRIEYKEFGTTVLVRPKLNETRDAVTLDIAAEQAGLLPPGESAEEGAVPRGVPGLVSHKFKLTSEVKLGGSLLVAEAAPDKKELREAMKQQFLLVIKYEEATREAAAVYADPAAAKQGEERRKATEAAIEAATAAEPAPGTAAAALLKAEREARHQETAHLKQQIDALQKQLTELRALTGPKSRESQPPAPVVDSRYDRDDAGAASRRVGEVRLAQLDLAEAKLLLQAAERDYARIEQLRGTSGVSQQEVDHKRHALELAKIQVQRAETKLAASSPAAAPVTPTRPTPPDKRGEPDSTEVRLLELDVAEAKLAVEEAEAQLSHAMFLRARSPASLTSAQIESSQANLGRAKIQLQRAQIKLEAAKEPAASRGR